MALIVTIAWILFSLVIAAGAHKRKRFAFGWFLLSLAISPLLAALALLLLGDNSTPEQNTQLRICDFCKAPVALDALKCRYCASDISADAQPIPPKTQRQIAQEKASPIGFGAWLVVGIVGALALLAKCH